MFLYTVKLKNYIIFFLQDFRLWLSSRPTDNFSVPTLQLGVKVKQSPTFYGNRIKKLDCFGFVKRSSFFVLSPSK